MPVNERDLDASHNKQEGGWEGWDWWAGLLPQNRQSPPGLSSHDAVFWSQSRCRNWNTQTHGGCGASVKISMKPLRHPPGAGTKLGTNSDKITTVYCWCVGLFFAKFWQAAFKLRLLIFGPHLKSWEYLLFGPSLNTYRTNPPLSQNSNKAWLSFFLKAKSNKAEELNALTGIKSPIDSARWDVSHWKIFLLNFLTCKIWVWWLT